MKVLILTTFEDDEYIFEALRAGASGFVLKDTEPAELVRAVRIVAAGEALLAPSITRKLIADYSNRAGRSRRAIAPSLAELTPREREVMTLVAEGLSNDEIAQRLIVSPLTAKTHVSRAMLKLGARDRAQLVVIAYRTGLVRAESAEQTLAQPARSPASRQLASDHHQRHQPSVVHESGSVTGPEGDARVVRGHALRAEAATCS